MEMIDRAVDICMRVLSACQATPSTTDIFLTAKKQNYEKINLCFYQEYSNHLPDISGTRYDAAHVIWGGKWRIPTREEVSELIRNCRIEHAIMNDVHGVRAVAANGKSIFLPVFDNPDKGSHIQGDYWISTDFYSSQTEILHILYATELILPDFSYSSYDGVETKISFAQSAAYRGLAIRPVMDK